MGLDSMMGAKDKTAAVDRKVGVDSPTLYIKTVFEGWRQKLNWGGVLNLFEKNSVRPIDIEGKENIPRDGSFILAANHFARATDKVNMIGIHKDNDMFVAMSQLNKLVRENTKNGKVLWPESTEPRPNFKLTPANLIRKTFFQVFKHADDIVPVPYVDSNPKSGRPVDVKSLMRLVRKTIDHLKSGGVLAIFPEGEAAYYLKKAKPGMSHFAIKLQKSVVPVSMYDRDGTLMVKVHQPLVPPKDLGEREAFTKKVMTTIASGLPVELRGAYKESVTT